MHPYNLRPLARRLRLKRAKTFNEDNMERQYTALPYPHMCYIRESADAETQLKLRQTCKYFHKMNRRLIVENLYVGYPRPRKPGKYDLYVQNFDEMPMIDVVTNGIDCDPFDRKMISKIRRCEAKAIWFPECELSMKEFLFFTQSGMVQVWDSIDAKVRDEHGKPISIENLLLHLPNAEFVSAKLQDIAREGSSKNVSWNKKIKELELDLLGPINVDHFYELLKKVLAPHANLFIFFIDLANETYVPTFEAEMDAKMNTWTPQAEKPSLYIHLL